eukprot:3392479-Amphidinium_carterae.1
MTLGIGFGGQSGSNVRSQRTSLLEQNLGATKVLLGYMLFDVRVTPTWLCIRLSGYCDAQILRK